MDDELTQLLVQEWSAEQFSPHLTEALFRRLRDTRDFGGVPTPILLRFFLSVLTLRKIRLRTLGAFFGTLFRKFLDPTTFETARIGGSTRGEVERLEPADPWIGVLLSILNSFVLQQCLDSNPADSKLQREMGRLLDLLNEDVDVAESETPTRRGSFEPMFSRYLQSGSLTDSGLSTRQFVQKTQTVDFQVLPHSHFRIRRAGPAPTLPTPTPTMRHFQDFQERPKRPGRTFVTTRAKRLRRGSGSLRDPSLVLLSPLEYLDVHVTRPLDDAERRATELAEENRRRMAQKNVFSRAEQDRHSRDKKKSFFISKKPSGFDQREKLRKAKMLIARRQREKARAAKANPNAGDDRKEVSEPRGKSQSNLVPPDPGLAKKSTGGARLLAFSETVSMMRKRKTKPVMKRRTPRKKQPDEQPQLITRKRKRGDVAPGVPASIAESVAEVTQVAPSPKKRKTNQFAGGSAGPSRFPTAAQPHTEPATSTPSVPVRPEQPLQPESLAGLQTYDSVDLATLINMYATHRNRVLSHHEKIRKEAVLVRQGRLSAEVLSKHKTTVAKFGARVKSLHTYIVQRRERELQSVAAAPKQVSAPAPARSGMPSPNPVPPNPVPVPVVQSPPLRGRRPREMTFSATPSRRPVAGKRLSQEQFLRLYQTNEEFRRTVDQQKTLATRQAPVRQAPAPTHQSGNLTERFLEEGPQ